ncbi:hypothetical protein FE257_009967 [Aspergillus nanangensis]|uniref:Uncharacterized protein n=1 Tax=Aspergillus nanangensis TaxID=2582783 RepID=A0AAD4CWL8_ASPNN|nr:hypothetical protein FE257_009967 [Aspergillus nanangensis]
MRFTLPLLSLCAATPALCVNYTAPGYSAQKLYQLANSTWISEIASPESSYEMRMTLFDRPDVYAVDPTHQHGGPRSIHSFPDSYGLSAITTLGYEEYGILAMGQQNHSTFVSLWVLRLNGAEPEAVRVMDKIGNITALGAITTLSETVVLASQTAEGTVYRIDLVSREVELVLRDPSRAKALYGIHYRAPYLYYTNYDEGVFARMAIDPVTAAQRGAAEVIARSELLVGADKFVLVDDGSADDDVDAFIVNFKKNSLVRVRNGHAELVVQGIVMPTTVQFGNGGGLYVATASEAGEMGASLWSISTPDV